MYRLGSRTTADCFFTIRLKLYTQPSTLGTIVVFGQEKPQLRPLKCCNKINHSNTALRNIHRCVVLILIDFDICSVK